MSEQFFVNAQYMNKSFSSFLPFSSPSLNGVWLIHHNSSEIVAKLVAFSFEGLEETFGECFFSRSKKETVFSAHDICFIFFYLFFLSISVLQKTFALVEARD